MKNLRNVLLLLISAFVGACSSTLRLSPFSDVDFSKLSPHAKSILQSANDDFISIANGKKPPHATLKEALLDGGTEIYKGDEYTITSFNALSRLGDLAGYITGPQLTFDETFASEGRNTVSNLRFVPLLKAVPVDSGIPGVISNLPADGERNEK